MIFVCERKYPVIDMSERSWFTCTSSSAMSRQSAAHWTWNRDGFEKLFSFLLV